MFDLVLHSSLDDLVDRNVISNLSHSVVLLVKHTTYDGTALPEFLNLHIQIKLSPHDKIYSPWALFARRLIKVLEDQSKVAKS